MANESRSLENLQTALGMEMKAIHQYLLHAHVPGDRGLDILSNRMREEMTEELGHAGRFIDRILHLEGSPKIEVGGAARRVSAGGVVHRRSRG